MPEIRAIHTISKGVCLPAKTRKDTYQNPKNQPITTVFTLSLTLLVGGIRTDYPHHALAPDNSAIAAHFLYRSSDFHVFLLNSSDPGKASA